MSQQDPDVDYRLEFFFSFIQVIFLEIPFVIFSFALNVNKIHFIFSVCFMILGHLSSFKIFLFIISKYPYE